MKSVVADFPTRVYCVRFVAVDGTTLRFAAYPHDLTMSNGAVYQAGGGYDPTDYAATTTLSPGVIDLEGILDAAGIDRSNIESGNWDNAKVYVFLTSYSTPVEDEEEGGQMLTGKFRVEDNTYVCELMHLIDTLNQSVGRSIGPLCAWTLFDETLDGVTIPANRLRCTGPRAATDGPLLASFKVAGVVTAVTSKRVWTDSGLITSPITYDEDYFAAGSIRFLTGNNAGLRSQEIKSSGADGVISSFLDWYYDIQVGDTYEMIPGCRKRRDEDCVAKYSNAINHGGFPDLVAPSEYAKIGGADQ